MSWLFVSNIIACVCGFIWTILITRYLPVSEYGILGFATSLTTILSITIDFGITTHIVRHVATDYGSVNKYMGNAIPLKSLFSIIMALLTLACILLMKCDEVTLTVTIIIAIYMIIKSFMGLFESVFQAFEIGKYQGIGNIILNIATFVFIVIAIFIDLGIYGISISYLIASVMALIYEYYAIKKHVAKPNFEFDRKFCRKITIASLPFAAGAILYSIYYSIDIVMLTNLIGNYATGIYNASYKLLSVITALYGIYGTVMFPIMNKLFKNDEKMLTVTFEKSIKYLMMIIIPLALSITIYSKDIIYFAYGPQYGPTSLTLSILIWTVCLLFITTVCNILLTASYKEVSVTKIYALAAAFNIILNFVMIPYFSYNGAAVTTVMSDLLIMIIQLYLIYKLGHRVNKKLYVDLGKIIMGSGILAIALYVLNLNMWVALPVGIIIYLASIILLRLFDDDDRYVIREILNRN